MKTTLKEKSIYLLLLMPTLTEWLESGQLPQTPHDIISDLALTLIVLGFILVSRKQSKEIKQLEETIHEAELFDPLTRLPRQERFNEDLGYALASAKEKQESFHIVCIDIDRFKDVNEHYGYAIGDDVLKALVKQIKSVLSEKNGSLYRLDADSFAFICRDSAAYKEEELVTNLVTLRASGQKLLADYQTTLSIGSAKYKDGDNQDKLWLRAVEQMKEKRQALSTAA